MKRLFYGSEIFRLFSWYLFSDFFHISGLKSSFLGQITYFKILFSLESNFKQDNLKCFKNINYFCTKKQKNENLIFQFLKNWMFFFKQFAFSCLKLNSELHWFVNYTSTWLENAFYFILSGKLRWEKTHPDDWSIEISRLCCNKFWS